tara:strand:+ start:584 stop:931 length:348 start_codon:yes stop_codon:yes gene_type:complete
MANGNWDDAVAHASDDANGDNLMVGLAQGDRHREILREQALVALSGVLISSFRTGESSMDKVNAEIDKAIQSVIANSKKDGIDLDDELLDILADASGKMLGIAEEWHAVKVILTQ